MEREGPKDERSYHVRREARWRRIEMSHLTAATKTLASE